MARIRKEDNPDYWHTCKFCGDGFFSTYIRPKPPECCTAAECRSKNAVESNKKARGKS